jgi:hypothetical protein
LFKKRKKERNAKFISPNSNTIFTLLFWKYVIFQKQRNYSNFEKVVMPIDLSHTKKKTGWRSVRFSGAIKVSSGCALLLLQ